MIGCDPDRSLLVFLSAPLDRRPKPEFCRDMKAALVLVILVAFAAVRGEAQNQNIGKNNLFSTTNSATISDSSRLSLQDSARVKLRLAEPSNTNSVDYVISKTKVHLTGPVATTLKPRSVGDFSHRVLHLFSPFSKDEPNLSPAAPSGTGPVSTRAWSTIVGWSPGRSAFPDEHFHEPPQ